MPGVKTYEPKQVSLIVGGKIISGFSDGTFISLMRDEQAFTKKIGVDGEGTRSKSNNKGGKFEIELMQSSASNDDLSGFAAADESANTGAVPVRMVDNSGRTVASCLTGWVQKIPDSPFAKEVQVRKWVIDTDELLVFIGGN